MIISKFDIIKSKQTDAFSNLAKIKAWSEITTLFNSQSIIQKKTEQLKSIFKNKKCDIRKELAIDNAERFITGGGSFQHRVTDESPFLAFVQDSCTPQSGVIDSDTPVHPETICLSEDEDDFIILEVIDERKPQVIPDTPQPSTSAMMKQENKENETVRPGVRKRPCTLDNLKKNSKTFKPEPASRASKILSSQTMKDKILEGHKKMQETKQKILEAKLKYWELKSKNIN